MEVGTGATFSVIGESALQLWDPPLQILPSNVTLTTFSGEIIKTIGEASVNVEYQGQNILVKLLIVPGMRTALLGHDWMQMIRLNWREFVKVKTSSPQVNQLDEIEEKRTKFPLLFREKDGRLKNFKAHLQPEPDAIPKFKKKRATKLDLEYQRLRDEDIVEDVTYSDWASPPVPVLKCDGSVLKHEIYPLPAPDDLFNKLEGGVMFAKLDLSHAYQQIELDEESQKLMVLNTHQGLLKYKRLNYGMASAPAIFQRAIEGILQGILGTAVYLLDIIVTGCSKEEYEWNLDQTAGETAGGFQVNPAHEEV